MIYRNPDYCRKFRCIADKCGDNCCIGWEIDIDEKTAEYYEKVGGEFGEKLRKNISGNSFVLGENERCPFLNDCNLCEIFINLGEDKLCGTDGCICQKGKMRGGNCCAGTASDDYSESEQLPAKAQINGSLCHITATFGMAIAGMIINHIIDKA